MLICFQKAFLTFGSKSNFCFVHMMHSLRFCKPVPKAERTLHYMLVISLEQVISNLLEARRKGQ